MLVVSPPQQHNQRNLPPMNWESQLTIAIVGAVVAIVGVLTTVFRKVLDALGDKIVRRIQMSDRRYRNGLEEVAKFHAIFERMREMEFIDRLLVFEGKNCGGIPRAGKPFTIHSMFGWSNAPSRHPEQVYDADFRVDSHYIEMLRNLIEKRSLEIKTEDLPKGSQLRSFYTVEGVVASNIYFLRINDDEGSLVYASVASYRAPFNEDQSNRINLMIERIRGLIVDGVDPGSVLPTSLK